MMAGRKKILFIIPAQYGYHTDSYKYCECLSERYDMFYVGFDKELPERNSNNVRISSLKLKRFWRFSFFKTVFYLNRQFHFDAIFVYSFPLCSLFLFAIKRKHIILDIRTSVVAGKFETKVLNRLLSIESLFFKRISVISDGVVDFLSLDKGKSRLLPLGGDDVGYYERDVEGIALLYVGTFYDRHIEKTIEGLGLFLKKYPTTNIRYTIIGLGSDAEKQCIMNTIQSCNLSDYVQFVGEKRHEELIPYFQTHNVGVSYIPLTTYYDCQPPTKTYEYLLNSMIVLATPTFENRKVVNEKNGVLLLGDSSIDFADAIEILLQRIGEFDTKTIYAESVQFSWTNIVDKYLIPIIEEK